MDEPDDERDDEQRGDAMSTEGADAGAQGDEAGIQGDEAGAQGDAAGIQSDDAGARGDEAGIQSDEMAEQRGGDDDLLHQQADGAGADFEDVHAREDEEEDEEQEEEEEADEDHFESVVVEITGLSLYTHHGVSEAEREVGQRLVLDLRLELGESDATVTDRIEDTVDYAEVCQLVTLIAQQRSHKTLERLCSTIADRLVADYEVASVWVKATKPEPPIALPVEEVSVEVWRDPPE